MPHRVRYLFLLILAVASIAPASSAAWQAHAEEKPGHVGYDKGLYMKTDDDKFKVGINILLQPQYQYLSMEGQDDTSTVQIRRGQFIFSGNAFTKDLTYRIQYEAIGGATTTAVEGVARATSLNDAYLNYRYSDGIQIMAGQFKPFFNREELTSDTKLSFVDRSIATDVLGFGRDLGLAVHGKLAEQKFEYGLYAANEANSRNTSNFNNHFLLGARFLYNALGNHGYTEGDSKGSDAHQLALGIGANYNAANRTDSDEILAGTADIAYMWKGLSLIAEADYALELSAAADNTVWGGRAQVGYFIVPEKFQAAVRGVAIIPTMAGDPNGYEYAASLGYYFFDHNVKLVADYALFINSPFVFNATAAPRSFVRDGSGATIGFNQDQTDQRVRTQLQLYF